MVRNGIVEVQVTTETGLEPVTPAEAKSWIKMDYNTDDQLITSLVTSARKYAESYTGKSFLLKVVVVLLTHDAIRGVRLPRGPVGDITLVEYRTCRLADWTDITANTDEWEVSGLQEKEFEGIRQGSYRVTFEAGYANGLCPEDVKTAILKIFARLYQNRGDVKGFELVQEDHDILNPHCYRQWV